MLSKLSQVMRFSLHGLFIRKWPFSLANRRRLENPKGIETIIWDGVGEGPDCRAKDEAEKSMI